MKLTALTACLAFSLLGAAPALAQETFSDEAVQRARTFYEANASAIDHKDCLETLNEGMRLLFNDRGMRLSSTVDLTMSALARIGRAREARKFGFFDEEGRATFGVTQPEQLRESVWDGLVAMSGGARGWSVFGFSPLDGNHSVTLYLDTRGDEPQVYWADQWSTKGGFKLYASKDELDGEIERLTSSWWRSKLAEKGVKFKTDAKIYQLIPPGGLVEVADEPAEGEQAEIVRAPRLNLRSGPGTNHRAVSSGTRGQRFKVVGHEGIWVQLENAQGERFWAHGRFLQVTTQPREGAVDALRVMSRR